MLFIIAMQHNKQSSKEKAPNVIKEGLLDSLTEIEDEDKPGLSKVIKYTKEPKKRHQETKKGIHLYNFLAKYPIIKKLAIASNYFEIHFRLIKKNCHENVNIFGKKELSIFLLVLLLDFSLVARIFFC